MKLSSMSVANRGRLLSLIFSAFLAVFSVVASAENIHIKVFHTNDIHGWIMPQPARFHQENPKRLIGGAAVLAKAIERYREGRPYLLLDAGDWFQGTPEGTLTRGRVMVELFNALDYNAVVIGNHEFDFGEKNLKELVAQAKIPVLGANVLDQMTGRSVSYLKPYLLEEISGVKIGIFGLLTTHMRRLTFEKHIAGLQFENEIKAAKRLVAELKAQGATVIIALTHIGLEAPDKPPFSGDRTLAKEVPGIDLVVGGHTHTSVTDPQREENGTLIVQTGSYLTRMGHVDLEIDPKSKKVLSSTGRLHDLWVDELGEDAKIQALVARYQKEVGQTLDVVIATATQALRRDRYQESTIGNWMTDCARQWTKTQIAFHNSGGIRADLPQGPVTLRDIFNIMPFDNALLTLRMKGQAIRGILEHALGGSTGMIQVSGLSFRYKADVRNGRRVTQVWVGDKPLKKHRLYSVSAVDFLVQGGDGYWAFDSARDRVHTGVLLRDVLSWCAREYSPIRPAALGRIMPAGKD